MQAYYRPDRTCRAFWSIMAGKKLQSEYPVKVLKTGGEKLAKAIVVTPENSSWKGVTIGVPLHCIVYKKATTTKLSAKDNGEYIAVVGSRTYNDETTIHAMVKRLLANGYGIASGGANGADHHALTALLKFNPQAGKIFTVGTRNYVAQSEAAPLHEFQRKGGIIRTGRINAKVSYQEYTKALFQRTDAMMKDSTVKAVIAFIDPAAENNGTWYTVEAAIAREKRAIVVSTDEKALQDFPDGYWRKLEYTPDAYLWVVRYSKPIVTIEDFRWKETIEKRHAAPALAARTNQPEDIELLEAETPRIQPDLTFNDTDATPPPFNRSACKQTRWSAPIPPPDKDLGSYTVNVSSVTEAIEAVNPDQPWPVFSNELDRLTWESFMDAPGTKAMREDIAEPRLYRQIPHITAKTGATPAQAEELRQYWDILGDTPELFRFYLADTKLKGIEEALAYYHTLAEALEKVTQVSDEDLIRAWTCFTMAEEGDEDDPTEDFDEDDSENVRTWIPLGEIDIPSWLSQQPKQYQDLIEAIEEATPADLPAIGKELYETSTVLTKAQRMVAFETYARAKEKDLARAERQMKSDALKVKRAILKAKDKAHLAHLGQRMHKGQKEAKAEINPREWSVLWQLYHQKKAKALS